MKALKILAHLFFTICLFTSLQAQLVQVGSGSYTNTFPGTDEAGRNGFPSGTPQLSGNAVGKPVPTNDWWSKLIKENHADNLFNYPMTLKTVNEGLVVTYIPWGVIDDIEPIIVGTTGMSASKATVSDYSDWTVTMNWNDGSHDFQAVSSIGMPFLYFEKESDDIAQVTISQGTTVISNEMLLVTDARNGADFVVYAPEGSTWTKNGTTYTSDLNGKDYWSMVMLPLTNTSVETTANEYKKYAYVFPTNTTTTWAYNETSGVMKTDFEVSTETKEGTETKVLMGLLPHQWGNLTNDSAQPDKDSYATVRGELKTLHGNTFSIENTFRGILPTMPYLANYSTSFSPSAMDQKIAQIENDALATWTDSYNEGQVLNRMIQTARIADQTGNIEARDKMIATIKERLEDWLTVESSEVAFLFYYNNDWSALLGYPSGHGQDNNINDHHFHWGYFIHAAAFMEQFEPGWADDWGEMVNHLVRDAASSDRNDSKFPYLRNFSPYAGHCWANGFATFPQGNDQESTSESMQFNSSLIHWGTITEDDDIRDLGIYLYTTEQTAIEEYWFDVNERTFKDDQQYSLVSRIWGNSYDNGTFWTSDIEASYGIELYPIHGGSLYLGYNTDYVEKLWNEMTQNTGILSNTDTNPNLWQDVLWKYLSFIDPEKAIELYNAYPDRGLKFGVSDAQTYHWLHAMNAMGKLRNDVTADYPIAAAFDKEGLKTYVAHNYSDVDITVAFSDGFTLDVPANKMATNRETTISGTITSDFFQAYPSGSVNLTAQASSDALTKVEFFDGNTLLGEKTSAPYSWKADNLTLGIHGMYAKIYDGENFNVTNIVSIQVGEQIPYSGNPSPIPGTIEAGHYDKFEGGVGQNISYFDGGQDNQGGFRPDEYVDAIVEAPEGATVGWIAGGEWVEYTVDVASAGTYDLSLRFASANGNGGGPFHLEVDGKDLTSDIPISSTGGWSDWESKTVNNIEFNQGEQILRVAMSDGEFNLGMMTFTRTGDLSYSPPVADAGNNINVILPASTTVLDGSLSADPDNETLTYLWEQIYGPSTVAFDDETVVSPQLSNLEEGIYKVQLTVSDGTYSSSNSILVIVSETGNTQPTVSLTSPENNASFVAGETISIAASASDLDGAVSKVEFYDGTSKIGEDATTPFEFDWVGATIGQHELWAKAIDDVGGEGESQTISITVNDVKSCSETSSEATEGVFSVGYKTTFETVGSDVTVTFELLDTDKVGVIAFLREETPFSESQMDNVSGNIFSKKINGLTTGSTISFACKFAYSGGLSVTKYVDYVVGDDCGGTEDIQAPTNLTASLGAIDVFTVELLLNANDDSGELIYKIAYGNQLETISSESGKAITKLIGGLTAETSYTFNITASDLAGNLAADVVTLTATTLVDNSSSCAGNSFKAREGAFDVGFSYGFETSGTDVEITFELLDTKEGVFAFLQKGSPFEEVQMTNVSGQTFTITLAGQTLGSVISYACKFEFAGGLVVTEYLKYTVGDNCDGSGVLGNENLNANRLEVYPNPVTSYLTLAYSASDQMVFHGIINIQGKEQVVLYETKHDKINFDLSDFKSGIYFLLVEQNGIVDQIRIVKN